MARTQSSETESKWRTRVAACEASGMSVRAYARHTGLHPHTLWGWKRRLEGTAAPNFVSVVVKQPVDDGNSASSGGTVEVVLKSGHVLRVRSDFDEATLARLLRVIG